LTGLIVVEIDHVQLAAPPGCEPAARAFFGGLLGLRELDRPAALRDVGGCWFRVGGRQLHIGVQVDGFQPALKAHPAFAVLEIEELFERLRSAGVDCKWDLMVPDVHRFFAADPWGNRLEFVAAAPINS